jgi:hypothetical protein
MNAGEWVCPFNGRKQKAESRKKTNMLAIGEKLTNQRADF